MVLAASKEFGFLDVENPMFVTVDKETCIATYSQW